MRILVVSRYTTDRRSATVVGELSKIAEVFNLTWSDHKELHPLRNMFNTGLKHFTYPQFCVHFDLPNTADKKAYEMCLERFNPDIVVLTNEVYEQGTHEQIELAHKYNAKVALVAWQNTMTEDNKRKHIDYILKTYTLADLILCGSTLALKFHESFGKGNFAVIPFLAVQEGLIYPKSREELTTGAKEIWSKWKPKFVVGYIGRFLEWKGVGEIGDAMEEIMEENKDVCFLAIGEGFDDDKPEDKQAAEGINKLKEKYPDRVEILKYLTTGEELNEFMNLCDIYLYPSKPIHGRIIEQFGVMMADAGLAMVPCVGPNIGGSTDIIQDKVTGYLINPNNYKELKESIMNYKNLNPSEKWKMKFKAIESCQQWRGSKVAERLLKAFEEVTNGKT